MVEHGLAQVELAVAGMEIGRLESGSCREDDTGALGALIADRRLIGAEIDACRAIMGGADAKAAAEQRESRNDSCQDTHHFPPQASRQRLSDPRSMPSPRRASAFGERAGPHSRKHQFVAWGLLRFGYGAPKSRLAGAKIWYSPTKG